MENERLSERNADFCVFKFRRPTFGDAEIVKCFGQELLAIRF